MSFFLPNISYNGKTVFRKFPLLLRQEMIINDLELFWSILLHSDQYDEFFVGFILVLSNLSTYLQRLDVKSIYVTCHCFSRGKSIKTPLWNVKYVSQSVFWPQKHLFQNKLMSAQRGPAAAAVVNLSVLIHLELDLPDSCRSAQFNSLLLQSYFAKVKYSQQSTQLLSNSCFTFFGCFYSGNWQLWKLFHWIKTEKLIMGSWEAMI